MTFRFPFVSIPTSRPVPSLASRRDRPRPIIPITVINPATLAARRYRAVLDTGADDTVFHENAARLLGINLAGATGGQAQGTTGTPVGLRYADVFLQLADPLGNVLEWRATVAFAPAAAAYPLLGFAGFLQYFDTTFFGELEEVELIPNALLPSHSPTRIGP
jgi:hypothetical protein